MAFVAEMINVAATLGGGYLGNRAVNYFAPATQLSPIYTVGGMAAGFALSYAGNLICNGYGAKELRQKMHDRVVGALQSQHSFSLDEANQAFDHYYVTDPKLKPGILSNVGNIICTNLMGGIGGFFGLAATTALCTTMGKGLDAVFKQGNKLATYGFVAGTVVGPAIGTLAGGYVGNKVLQGPGNKKLTAASESMVQRILQERALVQPSPHQGSAR